MAKGQKRSNREIRKPKKAKASVAAPPAPARSVVGSINAPKKKF